MQTKKMQTIYDSLQLTSVFSGVVKKPLFTAFFGYCEAEQTDKKRAYANFVAEIYKAGGNLTEFTQSLIFEDENVFVKGKAKDENIPLCVKESTARELKVFSAFASLTRDDFTADLGVNATLLPAFDSETRDFVTAYDKRLPRSIYFPRYF